MPLPRFLGVPLAALCLICIAPALCLDNGLALTPPMGWNSWNTFAGGVSEHLIRETADAMVSSGMKAVGYEYVNIDDGWAGQRDAKGYIHPNTTLFPSGMKALADYVHSKGLKLGIYSDAGFFTCLGKPGSYGYEKQDAEQYAKWGIDLLKYDYCYAISPAESLYPKMRDALNATGRPILFSLCDAGYFNVWEWGKGVGNTWRTTPDIKANWRTWTRNLDLQVAFGVAPFAAPGGWNDPDMLEVGVGSMTLDESLAHFSLWAIMAAPLLAGNDIRNMSPEVKNILTNTEVIAVDQDPLGVQGTRVYQEVVQPLEIWSKPLHDGSQAIVLFNRGMNTTDMTIFWYQIGLSDSASVLVRDLWQRKNIGVHKVVFTAADIPARGARMFRFTQQ